MSLLLLSHSRVIVSCLHKRVFCLLSGSSLCASRCRVAEGGRSRACASARSVEVSSSLVERRTLNENRDARAPLSPLCPASQGHQLTAFNSHGPRRPGRLRPVARAQRKKTPPAAAPARRSTLLAPLVVVVFSLDRFALCFCQVLVSLSNPLHSFAAAAAACAAGAAGAPAAPAPAGAAAAAGAAAPPPLPAPAAPAAPAAPPAPTPLTIHSRCRSRSCTTSSSGL